MAGVKGRSGGPRPNSGGKRPGAGRKPKVPAVESANPPASSPGVQEPAQAEAVPAIPDQDPLDFLLAVQNSPLAPLKDRIRAAVAAAQYKHTKTGDGGKKEAAADRAKKAAGGRFAPKAPPRLVVNNR